MKNVATENRFSFEMQLTQLYGIWNSSHACRVKSSDLMWVVTCELLHRHSEAIKKHASDKKKRTHIHNAADINEEEQKEKRIPKKMYTEKTHGMFGRLQKSGRRKGTTNKLRSQTR